MKDHVREDQGSEGSCTFHDRRGKVLKPMRNGVAFIVLEVKSDLVINTFMKDHVHEDQGSEGLCTFHNIKDNVLKSYTEK